MKNISNKDLGKIISSIFVLILFIITFVFILQDKHLRVKEDGYTNKPSECLRLLEQVNSSLFPESEWEAVEINEVNGIPISVNNLDAKKLQEVIEDHNYIQANYGPFIMEKRIKKGGKFIQEINSELIKCAQDRIIMSIWQPDPKIIIDGREAVWLDNLFDEKDLIGSIYVSYVDIGKNIFSNIYVVKEIDGKNILFYEINDKGFFNQINKDTEIPVTSNFYGYKISTTDKDSFMVNLVSNDEKDISDDVTVQWNYDKNIFEVLKF